MRWSKDDLAWNYAPRRPGICALGAALALGGTALVGGAISAGSANHAANLQADAANRSAEVQQNMFDTTQKNLDPFIGGGQNALTLLLQQLGINPGTPGTPATPGSTLPDGTTVGGSPAVPGTPPSFNPNAPLVSPQGQFTPNMGPFNYGSFNSGMQPVSLGTLGTPQAFSFNPGDLANTPGYQFQLQQGLDAVQHQAARGGGALGGNSLKAMQSYAQGLAGSTYDKAFDQSAQTYGINAATPLSYLSANNDALLKGYTTNFGDALASYGVNQGNAQSSYNTNFGNDLSIFNTNANVGQQNKNNIFNMLNTILQTGQASAAGAGNIGATTGANIGNAYTQAGNASAAGAVGVGNAISGGINNASQAYLLAKLFGGG